MISACGGPSRTVSRVGVEEVTDLSGRWNDTDSRLVAQKMINGMIQRPWIDNFVQNHGRKPVVIVGNIRNLSSEHIQTDTFISDIEREFVNSGRLKFVASSEERQQIRSERMQQQSYSSMETAKRLAAETGADFMLTGSIKTQIDAADGKQAKFYQVDLELINLETNEKVWMDTQKIKKLVEQKKAKW
ncbi:MAG: penicillin-binding protein activator [Candidatus Cloacimonadota bacterium]|nr:penicillin-binding protein activator [Candidatus Cloacimonadota bacterium]